MAITVNGNGTITGISAGGLPDDVITAADLANSINTSIAANTAKTGISSAQTSAITANTAKTGITSSQATAITAALPKAGGTMTNNLTLADGVRLNVGTNADLKLYHDNSSGNTFIDESGSGRLFIRASRIDLTSLAGDESMASFVDDAGAELFHNNVLKLEVVSNGIRVTDRVTGSGDLILATVDSNEKIHMDSDGYIKLETNGTERMRIDSSGNVGIGTASPDTALNVAGYIRGEAGSTPKLQLKRTGNAAGNGYIECLGSDDSVDYKIAFAQTAGTMSFSTAAANAMNIDSGGSVGIGTTSPTRALTVASTGDTHINTTSSHANGYSMFVSENSSDANNSWGVGRWHDGRYVISHNAAATWSQTGDTERLVIDTSGKVGIGTTSPAKELHTMNASQSVANRVAYNGSYYTDYGYYNINTQSNNFVLKTTGTTRFTVRNDTGYLQVASGITFGTDTAAANSLNDYEEGNWTPVIGGTSQSGQSYEGQTGRYTKIGRQVFCSAYVALSNEGSISGFLRIKGFPFGVDPTNIGGVAFAYTSNWLLSSGHWIEGWVYTDNLIYLYETNGSGGATQLSSDHCTNNSRFAMTFSFQTND